MTRRTSTVTPLKWIPRFKSCLVWRSRRSIGDCVAVAVHRHVASHETVFGSNFTLGGDADRFFPTLKTENPELTAFLNHEFVEVGPKFPLESGTGHTLHF